MGRSLGVSVTIEVCVFDHRIYGFMDFLRPDKVMARILCCKNRMYLMYVEESSKDEAICVEV